MPVTLRTFRRRFKRRARPRRVAGLATRPRMMSKSLTRKRFNQVSTRVFWFKINGDIAANSLGRNLSYWNARSFNNSPPVGWPQLRQLYDQYKVLAIKVKMFPSNVGTESGAASTDVSNRGDTVVWSDQRFDATQTPVPTQIGQVINNASARMINSRRPYSRTIYRGTGYPEWAQTHGPVTTDSWNGAVLVIINGASPALVGPPPPPRLWYYTVQFKIIVRGRTQY